MDPSTIAPLTLSAEMGVAFYLAIGVIFLVNGVRWLCEILPTTKTNNLPGWIWVLVAMTLAVIVCFFLHVDQIARMFALTDIVIPAPWSYVATGIAIGMSSNILYLATEPIRKKYRKGDKIVTLGKGEPLPEGVTEENDYCLPVPELVQGQEPQQPSTDAGNSIQPVVPEPPVVQPAQPEEVVPVPVFVETSQGELVTPMEWTKATLLARASIVAPAEYVALGIGPDAKLYEVERRLRG